MTIPFMKSPTEKVAVVTTVEAMRRLGIRSRTTWTRWTTAAGIRPAYMSRRRGRVEMWAVDDVDRLAHLHNRSVIE